MSVVVARALLRKDARLFVDRPHFKGYLALIFVSIAFTLGTGLLSYRQQLHAVERWGRLNTESVAQVVYLASLAGPGYTQMLPPNPLAVLVHGSEDIITSPFVTRHWSKQEIGYISPRGPLANFILDLDFATFVLLFAPLLVMYLSHTALRDELVARTAQTNFLFNVSPRLMVASKYAVSLVGTLAPVALASCFALAVLTLLTGLSSEQIARGVAVIGVEVLYLAFWVSVVFVLQLFGKTSKAVMAAAIVFWVSVVFVIPPLLFAQRTSQHNLNEVEYFAAMARSYRDVSATWVSYKPSTPERPNPTDPNDNFRFMSQVFLTIQANNVSGKAYEDLSAYYDGLTTRPSLGQISPFYVAALVMTEAAGTGVGDYLNFRRSMVDYQRQYIEGYRSPALREWYSHGGSGRHPSTAQMEAWLGFKPRRLRPADTARRVVYPSLALALMNVLAALCVFVVCTRLLEQRLMRLTE